jgi:Zn-finger nucleic acid-binding protein
VLSTCRSCGGLWLDTATVDRLRNARDEALELAVRRIADPGLDAAGRDLRVAITCPICRTRLRRVPIPNSAHDVDVCDAHGTWFDRVQGDELQMFINAFEAARTPASDDDLRPAGLGDGFFSRLFRSRA